MSSSSLDDDGGGDCYAGTTIQAVMREDGDTNHDGSIIGLIKPQQPQPQQQPQDPQDPPPAPISPSKMNTPTAETRKQQPQPPSLSSSSKSPSTPGSSRKVGGSSGGSGHSKSPSGNSHSSSTGGHTNQHHNKSSSRSGGGGISSSSSKSPMNKSPRSNSLRSGTAGGGKRKPRPVIKKKGITFKKTVGVHTIPNLDTYSIAEKDGTWYAPDDYGLMEDECDLTAELLDRNKPLFPGHCPRGLEAWTTEGEQRKEGHVQLAIDIVWQAQLEQWKASSDIHECWEFIRSRYLAVSAPCHKLAHKRGLSDEKEVQPYLLGVRSVEKNRLRLLGIHHRSSSGSAAAASLLPAGNSHGSNGSSLRWNAGSTDTIAGTPRSTSSKKKIGRTYSESSSPRPAAPGRNHSSGNIKAPTKGVLKSSNHPIGDEGLHPTPVSAGGKIRRQPNQPQPQQQDMDDALSAASSRRSAASSSAAGGARKISYQPKSRSKVPVSPVGSVMSSADASDGDSTIRRMRSHMSVASDDSTRRRMLRTTTIKPPL